MHRILSTRSVGLISICLVCTFLASLHNLGKEGLNSSDFFTFVLVQTGREILKEQMSGRNSRFQYTHPPGEHLCPEI